MAIPPSDAPAPVARLSMLGATDLSGPEARVLPAGAVQPKRLVLLAYLALARGFVRRDSLLALFWPELPTDQARHALRQSLHYLRSNLGRDVIVSRGEGELAVEPTLLWCDARLFEERLAAGDAAGAMALHRCTLLDGVWVAEAAPELEEWLDAERTRFRRLASGAAAGLAGAAAAVGDGKVAIAWARQAAVLDPDDESAVRSLVELLEREGDRASALRVYTAFEERLRQEYDTAPSEATRALRARLGVAPPLSPASPTPSTDGAVPAGHPSAPRPRQTMQPLVAALLVVAVLLGVAALRRPAPTDATVLAVGTLVALGDSVAALGEEAAHLRAMLATNLAQLEGLQVLSEGRLHEMVARARGSMAARDQVITAARRAGATEVVEGVLRRSGGRYQLELARLDLDGGTVSGTLAVEAERLHDLVAQATSQLAEEHRLPPPRRLLAGLTSQSPVARRSFERGLAAYYSGNSADGLRHLTAALEVDPEFFAAAYYLMLNAPSGEVRGDVRQRVLRAVAAADSAPERERLQIRTLWYTTANDPRALAHAESLATRYPAEPDGRYYLGNLLIHAGDFSGAIEQLQRAIAADSMLLDSARVGAAPCRPCLAMQAVAQTHILMDSMDAAARWVDAWRRASPADSTSPIGYQAVLLDVTGRRAEALALVRDSMSPEFTAYWSASFLLESAVRAADFAEAERLIAADLASGDFERRSNGLWWDIIYHHTRGQLHEALAATDRFCAAGLPADDCVQIRAGILSRLGRHADAARGIDARLEIDVPQPDLVPGVSARRRTWLLTHLSEVHAASGDTAALAALVPLIREAGRRSGYGRDRRLHQHAQGLLHRARGEHAAAAAAFREAEYAPTFSLSQSRYYRAEALLALGRAGEAVEVLGPLTRRVLNATGSYFSQAEIHALLAAALLEAGRRDEALPHLAWAERAWEGADPPLQRRLSALRQAANSR